MSLKLFSNLRCHSEDRILLVKSLDFLFLLSVLLKNIAKISKSKLKENLSKEVIVNLEPGMSVMI